ncbi:hypothetical protein Nepgr_010405 [Nepenthes gracilis]|uniref:Uncharacterized protein n=1 Tax=Nepenthes gracilis TaxID=150966 RepID=A0AAD3XLA3_NEPGR|nr:hypothetical protein Nepgr_010405 [Nepenthes gracilis]
MCGQSFGLTIDGDFGSHKLISEHGVPHLVDVTPSASYDLHSSIQISSSASGNPVPCFELIIPGNLDGFSSLSWANTVKKDELSFNPPLKFYPSDKLEGGVASITSPSDVLNQDFPSRVKLCPVQNSYMGLESHVEVFVAYQWKPVKCGDCRTLGHTTSQCNSIKKSHLAPPSAKVVSCIKKQEDLIIAPCYGKAPACRSKVGSTMESSTSPTVGDGQLPADVVCELKSDVQEHSPSPVLPPASPFAELLEPCSGYILRSGSAVRDSVLQCNCASSKRQVIVCLSAAVSSDDAISDHNGSSCHGEGEDHDVDVPNLEDAESKRAIVGPSRCYGGFASVEGLNVDVEIAPAIKSRGTLHNGPDPVSQNGTLDGVRVGWAQDDPRKMQFQVDPNNQQVLVSSPMTALAQVEEVEVDDDGIHDPMLRAIEMLLKAEATLEYLVSFTLEQRLIVHEFLNRCWLAVTDETRDAFKSSSSLATVDQDSSSAPGQEGTWMRRIESRDDDILASQVLDEADQKSTPPSEQDGH